MRKLLEQSLNRLRAGEPVVWCVILAAEGSTPRGVGAKRAVFADGSSCGTVGGGAVELQAAAFARGLGDRAVIRSYDLYSGGSTATGMICGGRVELGFLPFPPRSAELLAGILEALEEPRGRGLRLWISPDGAFGLSLAEDADRTSGEPRLPKAPLCARQPDGSICLTEPLAPDYRIYLFGGGHVSAALVPVLLPLGFPVTVIDPRPELADPARFPGAWVIRGDFEPFPAAVKVTERDYIVVMTPAQSVGGFGAIGSMFPSYWSWYVFWHMTAFLSLILAFMNFLPIPALDGGYVLFLLYEMITRRKPSDKFLEVANNIGFWLLIALLIFANGNDILKIFF